MNKNLLTVIAVVLMGLMSCGQKAKTNDKPNNGVDLAHNSRNSLDWKGSYKGIVPCADCEGIETTLTLSDSTYVLETLYLGKGNKVYTDKGSFFWDGNGSVITLYDVNLKYLVGENYLRQLNLEGNIIESEHAEMYLLSKEEE
jgi:uncharacterized lipoprotein NlpE involved in copper resistance